MLGKGTIDHCLFVCNKLVKWLLRSFVDIEDGMDEAGVLEVGVADVVVVVGPRIRCWPSKSKEFKNSLSLDKRKTC